MSREFFRRYPRRERGEEAHWRFIASDGRYTIIRPSAHRLTSQIESFGRGCLYLTIAVIGCGIVTACATTYLLLLTGSK